MSNRLRCNMDNKNNNMSGVSAADTAVGSSPLSQSNSTGNSLDRQQWTQSSGQKSYQQRAPRSRSCSTLSSSQPGGRLPLSCISEAMKARKVIFYRNGDPFYKGLQFAIKSMLRKMENYQAFELLLAEINNSGLCDMNILKQGVRYIFDLNGSLITDVEQLEDSRSYVCSSSPVYKDLDYGGVSTVDWCVTTKKIASPSCALSMDTVPHQRFLEERHADAMSSKGFRPTCNKIIVVIRAGLRPRNIVRRLLNKRTANSFDQLLTHLARALVVDSGTIKQICTMYGRPVTELQDFFNEERVFIAFSTGEKASADDFKISDTESKFIDSVCGSAQSINRPATGLRGRASLHAGNTTHADSTSRTYATSSSSTPAINPSGVVTKSILSANPRPSNAVPAGSTASSRAKLVMKVNRGYSGKAYGIPVALLTRYKVGKTLAEGEFTTVKRCYEKSKDSRKFALKIINNEKLSSDQTKMLAAELSILRRLRHSNIVQLQDELLTPNEWYFIMDLFPGCDLYEAVVVADKFHYSELTVSWIINQLLVAVNYLHSLNIAHRNIRPENILVTRLTEADKQLKLGDFGLATEVNGFLHEIVGSDLFHSPEMFATKGYGLKADIWSIGIVCYLLLCGFTPFGSQYSIRDVLSTKVGCKQVVFPSPYWDCISDAAKDLILFMLEADQFVRGTAADMREHPWLADPSSGSDIDIHESVANKMNDLMTKSARFVPANVGLVAMTALDRGLGFQRTRKTSECGSPRSDTSSANEPTEYRNSATQ